MAIRLYLAMTAAEIRENTGLPPKIAWMACHFSPYCTGLSNLPRILAAGSVLMLDDVTPIFHHDPQQIAAQLRERTGQSISQKRFPAPWPCRSPTPGDFPARSFCRLYPTTFPRKPISPPGRGGKSGWKRRWTPRKSP